VTDVRRILLERVDAERDHLVAFLTGFIRAKSPNPPGDTREAVAYLTRTLDEAGAPYRLVAPQAEMPNIIGSFEGSGPGRHLVLNGHIDHFPVDEAGEGWSHPPYGGVVADGRIYGRGVVDMKCGTAAMLAAYTFLHEVRDHLAGRLTVTAVSDEETAGPWGARYLIENHGDEVLGDCLLNAEASGPTAIYFGEKGVLWLKVKVRTGGGHGATPHLGESATKIAARLMLDLEALSDIEPRMPERVSEILEANGDALDRAMGAGTAEVARMVSVNFGLLNAGLKINMIPGECDIGLDLRPPIGVDNERIIAEARRIAARYPGVTVVETTYEAPNWSEPEHEMVAILQEIVADVEGIEPRPVVRLGATDARLWRRAGIPTFTYGSRHGDVGGVDESVAVDNYINVVKVLTLAAHDYLTKR
jgi:succinyl-diaminopimelate desuccinylase